MSIKILYFVHGTTENNTSGKATGWASGKLPGLGITQAKKDISLVNYMDHIDIPFPGG